MIEGPRVQPIQRGLRQEEDKENLEDPLTGIDNGRGKDNHMQSTLHHRS